MALKDLQQRLGVVIERAEVLNKQNKLSADEEAEWERLIEESAALKANIGRARATDDIAEWGRKSGGVPTLAAQTEGFRSAGEVEVERKDGRLLVNEDGESLIDDKTRATISSPEYKSVYNRFLRVGREGLKDSELKVLQEGSDVAGGYLVTDEILARLISPEPAPTSVQGRVTRMNTGTDAMAIPRIVYSTDSIYTSGMRVTWTGEVPASATTHRVTEPSFGQIRIPIYTAMMSLPITNSMVEDASFGIVNWCTSKFNETVNLLYDNMILNGIGAGQPAGILRNPNGTDEPATVVSGAASALTADGIINLTFAVPEQYDDASVFVFNKTNCGRQIALLKDGDGRPLWSTGPQDSGLAVGFRNRPLQGYPVVLNAFMPNATTNTYPIIFGDLRGYYLVSRVAFSIQVLRELYAETDQILLLGRVRFGGAVVEPWRMKIQIVST